MLEENSQLTIGDQKSEEIDKPRHWSSMYCSMASRGTGLRSCSIAGNVRLRFSRRQTPIGSVTLSSTSTSSKSPAPSSNGSVPISRVVTVDRSHLDVKRPTRRSATPDSPEVRLWEVSPDRYWETRLRRGIHPLLRSEAHVALPQNQPAADEFWGMPPGALIEPA